MCNWFGDKVLNFLKVKHAKGNYKESCLYETFEYNSNIYLYL